MVAWLTEPVGGRIQLLCGDKKKVEPEGRKTAKFKESPGKEGNRIARGGTTSATQKLSVKEKGGHYAV